MTYDNVQSLKKVGLHSLFRTYIFWKIKGGWGVISTPTLSLFRFKGQQHSIGGVFPRILRNFFQSSFFVKQVWMASSTRTIFNKQQSNKSVTIIYQKADIPSSSGSPTATAGNVSRIFLKY